MSTTRKTRSFREIRTERLANPDVAAAYLSATQKNSPENFLSALKQVAQARKMATVARDSGVQRETLYRSFSEQGNPTWGTLVSVLSAVGVGVDFFSLKHISNTITVPATPGPVPMPSQAVRDLEDTPLIGRRDLRKGYEPLQGGEIVWSGQRGGAGQGALVGQESSVHERILAGQGVLAGQGALA